MSLIEKLPKPNCKKNGWPWDVETPVTIYDNSLVYPKITIVTPSYNQGSFLEETIRSILLQNYPNLEYIIIDGGSSDESVEIIKKYETWLSFWVSEKDFGQSHAINKGLLYSTGQLFNWINSDDCLNINALFHISHGFSKQTLKKDHALFVGNGNDIDVNSIILRDRYIYEIATPKNAGLLFSGNTPQSSVFFTTNLLKEVGGVNILLRYSMDIDLYIRIKQLNPEVIKVKASIGSFRVHNASKTSNELSMVFEKLAIFEALKFFIEKNYCKKMISTYILNMNFRNLDCQRKLKLTYTFLKNTNFTERYKFKLFLRKLLAM